MSFIDRLRRSDIVQWHAATIRCLFNACCTCSMSLNSARQSYNVTQWRPATVNCHSMTFGNRQLSLSDVGQSPIATQWHAQIVAFHSRAYGNCQMTHNSVRLLEFGPWQFSSRVLFLDIKSRTAVNKIRTYKKDGLHSKRIRSFMLIFINFFSILSGSGKLTCWVFCSSLSVLMSSILSSSWYWFFYTFLDYRIVLIKEIMLD